jgi:hypothetical protein
MMRSILAAGLVLVTSCGAKPASDAWVGCYRLETGAWNMTPESLLTEPPHVLRLQSERASLGAFYNGPNVDTVLTIVRIAQLDSSEARWWVIDSSRLHVATLGLAGRSLDLVGTPDSSQGRLETFTDMLAPDSAGTLRALTRQAPLAARRVACAR